MNASYTPMLCRSAERLPIGPEWLYEPKFDGFRTLIWRRGRTVRIRGRNGGALERSFDDIVGAARAQLPEDTVVDGELVICDDEGVCFDAVLDRLAGVHDTHPASVMAFDILRVRGRDVRSQPFAVRREVLEDSVGGSFVTVPQTDDPGVAETWLDRFVSRGVEGVVAKRRGDAYKGDQRRLVKVKRRRTVDCVVGGWRGDHEPESLLLGLYAGAALRYIGQTVRLSPDERTKAASVVECCGESAFDGVRPGISRWDGFRFGEEDWTPTVPNVVVEVAFTQLSYGAFRHAVRFLRWRPDRHASSCRFDQLPQR